MDCFLVFSFIPMLPASESSLFFFRSFVDFANVLSSAHGKSDCSKGSPIPCRVPILQLSHVVKPGKARKGYAHRGVRHTYMYVRVCIYIYIYIYNYMYVCIHTYTNIHVLGTSNPELSLDSGGLELLGGLIDQEYLRC